MAEVHTRAEALGCCRVELLSSKGLDRAHAFYSALGYQAAAEGLRINLPVPAEPFIPRRRRGIGS
jgi:hypothetical protein